MEKLQQAYYGYEFKKKSYEEYKQDLKVQELKKLLKQLLKQRLGDIFEYYLSKILGFTFLMIILVGSYILACICP